MCIIVLNAFWSLYVLLFNRWIWVQVQLVQHHSKILNIRLENKKRNIFSMVHKYLMKWYTSVDCTHKCETLQNWMNFFSNAGTIRHALHKTMFTQHTTSVMWHSTKSVFIVCGYLWIYIDTCTILIFYNSACNSNISTMQELAADKQIHDQ